MTQNGSLPHRPDAQRPDVDYGDDIHPPPGWRWNIARVLAAIVVGAMAIFWIVVFITDPEISHPDEINDPVFSESAEAVCASALERIGELPPAQRAESPEERGVVLDLATDELDTMIRGLSEVEPPEDPEAADIVEQWLADYAVYSTDRRDYAADLRAGLDTDFRISGNDDGVRITDLIDTFAAVNAMESCRPPGDV